MAVLSVEDLRRCWMRRKYRRLGSQATGGRRRRLKVEKLGGNRQQRVAKTTEASRRQNLRFCSDQLKLLGCLHDKYVKMMFGWAKTKSLFLGKKVAKKDCLVSVTSGEQVNVKLVFEMYKRVVLSRNLNVLSDGISHAVFMSLFC